MPAASAVRKRVDIYWLSESRIGNAGGNPTERAIGPGRGHGGRNAVELNRASLSKECRSGAKRGSKNSDLENPAHYNSLDAPRRAKLRIFTTRREEATGNASAPKLVWRHPTASFVAFYR